jgi:hypothetical protein
VGEKAGTYRLHHLNSSHWFFQKNKISDLNFSDVSGMFPLSTKQKLISKQKNQKLEFKMEDVESSVISSSYNMPESIDHANVEAVDSSAGSEEQHGR